MKIQYKELDGEMLHKNEKRIKDSLHFERINNELLSLKKKLQDQEGRNNFLKSTQENLKTKLKYLNAEIEKKQSILLEKESLFSLSEKKNLQETNKESDSLNNFRKNLKENREKEILISQKEKLLDSLSEELESKIERLSNIVAANKLLKTKIQKNEEIQIKYDLLSEKNAYLAEEINVLKKKIESLPDLLGKNLAILDKNIVSNDLKIEKEKKVNLNLKKDKLEQEFQNKKSKQEELEAENFLLNERIYDLSKELEGESSKNQQLLTAYNNFKQTLSNIEIKLQLNEELK
jgi:hypothetical protein